MRIKEVSEKVGLSHQAIYKRLRSRGKRAEDITIKGTGELTEEGEALMRELFPALQGEGQEGPQEASGSPSAGKNEELERLREEGSRLRAEGERLRAEVASLEEKNQALTEERDYLRGALERSQQLQAMTAAKIPAPPPAITDGTDKAQRRGLLSWLRGRGKDKG